MIKRILRNKEINIWSIISFVAVLLIIIPSANIFINLLNEPNSNWFHIKEFLLKKYFVNTIIISVWTGVLTVLIGISLAWIMTIYDFPFKKFMKWGLMLPLTIPAYIGAYTYHGMLNYTGIIQSTLRNLFGIKVNQAYFNIMNIKGVILVFTLFLFPYVYTITRSFLAKSTSSIIENARVLGSNPIKIFFKIILPISRGAIIGGVSLVILEVLNDYGVVKYYGVSTFSTAIFKTWFSMGDVESAIRLSAILMLLVLVVLVSERFTRGRRKYSMTSTKQRPITPIKLKGLTKYLITTYVLGIFTLSFVLPTIQLIHWAVLSYERIWDITFLKLIANSIGVASISTLIIIVIAVVVANNHRIYDTVISKLFSKVIVIGYSIPGAVIAIGVIVMFINLDRTLKPLYMQLSSSSKTLVLSTSILMLIFAYVIRFMAIGFNSIDAGFDKVGRKYFEASTLLGKNKLETFINVDLPMIKPAVISAFILVFIDTLKELPLTLILRPFNYNTLATKAFEYANDEMIHEASIPSLFIIIISIFFVYLMNKFTSSKETR